MFMKCPVGVRHSVRLEAAEGTGSPSSRSSSWWEQLPGDPLTARGHHITTTGLNAGTQRRTTEKAGMLESYYSKAIISYRQEVDYHGSFQLCIVLEEVRVFV